jgi:hypothetical protein
VCRAWRDAVCQDDELWRNLFRRHCWLHPHLARSVMPSERTTSGESERGRRREDVTSAGVEERRLRPAAALRGSVEESESGVSGGQRSRALRGWREAFQRAAHADAEVKTAHLVSRWIAQGRLTLRRLQPHWREEISVPQRSPPRGPRVCCARDDGMCALADTSVELGRGALVGRGELELSFAVAVNHGPPTRVPASALVEFAHAALLAVPLRCALPYFSP